MYIYQADCWCDACGRAIKDRLTAQGLAPEDPSDKRSYDSDEFPKYGQDDQESDGPQHCASGEECLCAEELSNGDKVGALLSTSLTGYGVEYLKGLIADGRYPELHEFWKSQFDCIDWREFDSLAAIHGMGNFSDAEAKSILEYFDGDVPSEDELAECCKDLDIHR